MDISTDVFLGWAAGFFDGEGCVIVEISNSPKSRRGHRTALRVSVTQTSKPCLELFVQRFGGSIRTFKHTCPNSSRWAIQHTWSVVGGRAYEFLSTIEPFVIVKKSQVTKALEYPLRNSAGKLYGNPGNLLPDEVHAKRVEIAYALRDIRASMKEAALPRGT